MGLVRAAALVVGALETVYAFAQGPAHTVWLSAGRGYHPLRRSPKRGAQLQTGSHGTRFAAAQLQMNSVVSCDGDQDARIATERWLDEWVVGLRLCPWAMASSREPQMKLLVVEEGASEIEAHIALVEGEARALEERVRCTANVNRAETEERTAEAPFTTLLVFPGDGYQEGGALECGAFPKLARRCEEAVRRFDQDMLAFHPNRVDHGPGCSGAPAPAATSHSAHPGPAPLPGLTSAPRGLLQRTRAMPPTSPSGARSRRCSSCAAPTSLQRETRGRCARCVRSAPQPRRCASLPRSASDGRAACAGRGGGAARQARGGAAGGAWAAHGEQAAAARDREPATGRAPRGAAGQASGGRRWRSVVAFRAVCCLSHARQKMNTTTTTMPTTLSRTLNTHSRAHARSAPGAGPAHAPLHGSTVSRTLTTRQGKILGATLHRATGEGGRVTWAKRAARHVRGALGGLRCCRRRLWNRGGLVGASTTRWACRGDSRLHRAGGRLSPRGVMRRSWIDLTPIYLSCWGRRCLAAARKAWGVGAAHKSTGRNGKRLGR